MFIVSKAQASISYEVGFTSVEEGFGASHALLVGTPVYEHRYFTLEAGLDFGLNFFVADTYSYCSEYFDSDCNSGGELWVFEPFLLFAAKIWTESALTENFIGISSGPRFAIQDGGEEDIVLGLLALKYSGGVYLKRPAGVPRLGVVFNLFLGDSPGGEEPAGLMQFLLSIKF